MERKKYVERIKLTRNNKSKCRIIEKLFSFRVGYFKEITGD